MFQPKNLRFLQNPFFLFGMFCSYSFPRLVVLASLGGLKICLCTKLNDMSGLHPKRICVCLLCMQLAIVLPDISKLFPTIIQ
ncbi:hypothetical protein BGZ63DRAFT_383165 [Mariannaea sp. PMI_226]|nr:hypothetical protein BGZ63DRAFT_383165 [Mariannaea sp. PMI_226]